MPRDRGVTGSFAGESVALFRSRRRHAHSSTTRRARGAFVRRAPERRTECTAESTGSARQIRAPIGFVRCAGLHDVRIDPGVEIGTAVQDSIAVPHECRPSVVATPLGERAARCDQGQGGILGSVVSIVVKSFHKIHSRVVAQFYSL